MTTKLKVTDFDFDTLKVDFKTFIKSRPEFTDYNFEGSNLNVILDILAYNTHYHSLMANFLANEMFLDTAAKRSSVVSHAKTLGYVPKSKSSATASVNLNMSFINTSITNLENQSFILRKGDTILQTNIDGTNYTFTLISNYSSPIELVSTNSYRVHYENVLLYEGEYTTNTATYNALTKFVNIPDIDVDLNTLIVEVKRASVTDYDTYTYAGNLLEVGTASRVFFIQEGYNGQYQIYFGDGQFGVEPTDGSVVRMSYIVTHGVGGNGATRWILNNPNSYIMAVDYAVEPIIGISSNGSDRESTTSIKFNAINHFGTQNRAVSAPDYAVLAKQHSNNVKQILSWGGEDNEPPLYNSVVLCAIPITGEDLTDAEKTAITDYLRSKAVGSTQIVFKTPEYLDIKLDVDFTYDKNLLKTTVYKLESDVRSMIGAYARDSLYNFDTTFKQSKLLTQIDRVADSITGSTITNTLIKTLSIQPFLHQNHVVDFSNQIDKSSQQPAVWTTSFYSSVNSNSPSYIIDDRAGILMMVSYDANNKLIVINKNVGSVNYITGVVSLNMAVTTYNDINFTVYCRPVSNNVSSTKNNILRIKNENITITARGE